MTFSASAASQLWDEHLVRDLLGGNTLQPGLRLSFTSLLLRELSRPMLPHSPLSPSSSSYLHPSTLIFLQRQNRGNAWCLFSLNTPSTCFPTTPVRRDRRRESGVEGERGKRQEKRRNTHRRRHTNDVVRQPCSLWTHSQLCLRVRLCVHTCGLTHHCIRQALHHCQVANLEGEAASCSCNKSQKALLCLSV